MNPIFSFHRHCLAGAALLSLASLGATRAETFTLEEATIEQMQKAMADGALTSVELTSLYLNRVAIYDRSGIKLNSIPAINAKVFDQAAAADDLRAAGGAIPGLTGVPVAVKDSFNVVGLPSSAGVAGWKDIFPTKDAFSVEKLREAGALILGKANMSSYAWSGDEAISDAYGTTLNPYAQDVAPGGSSGGSGVAAAANLVALTFGGETTGSIRNPADRNGLVGLKPTRGLIPTVGVCPLEFWTDVIGPLGRKVEDVAAALQAAAKPSAQDDWYPYLPPNVAGNQDYLTNLKLKTLAGVKLAIPKNLIGLGNGEYGANEVVDADIGEAFAAARRALEALGATIVEVDLPAFKSFAEAGTTPGAPDPFSFYSIGRGFPSESMGGLKRHFESLGVTNLADRVGQMPKSIIGHYVDDFLEAVNAGDFTNLSEEPFQKTLTDSNLILERDYRQFMTANSIDAFIFPNHSSRTKTTLAGLPGYEVINYLGCPLLVVPMSPAVAYSPFTMGFMGDQFSEAKLLGYAYAYQEATKLRRPPILAPALPGETIEYSTAAPPATRPELAPPALRVAAGAKVTGQGKKATLVIKGGAVDASGLRALTVYVNGRKIAAQITKKWKATVKLSALRQFVKGSAKTVQVTVVAKDIYGNTSVTTKTVKLPKTV